MHLKEYANTTNFYFGIQYKKLFIGGKSQLDTIPQLKTFTEMDIFFLITRKICYNTKLFLKNKCIFVDLLTNGFFFFKMDIF